MASTYISRTQGTPTNSKKWTISFWMKGKLTNGNFYAIFGCDYDQGDSYYGVGSGGQGRNEIGLLEYHTGATNYGQGYTDASLRDSSGWYHIVFAYDSTQATASDRGKTYINGVFNNSTYVNNIPLNHDSKFNTSGVGIRVGNRSAGGGSANYDGCLSYFHFIDGTAYTPSAFGEYDANGVWTIKTSPSVTYGTNGFFILKDGNSVTDQSGNSNNFTVAGGTLTNTEDSPSNVFATMNPLDNYWQGSTFSNGNNTILTGSNSATFNTSTLLMTSGKYYVEVKPTVGSATLNIGVTGEQAVSASQTLASRGSGYAYLSSSGVFNNGSSVGGTFNSYSNGDIIGIAINLDDEQGGLNKLYFSKNGVWQNGADPSTPSSVTGVVGITKPSNLTGGGSKMGAYAFAINETWNDNTRTVQWNFGNGYFGTTAIASAGTNASGIGIFEYDVPTGYTALSTKGLNL